MAMEVSEIRRSSSKSLGDAIQRAAEAGQAIEFGQGQVEVGCKCVLASSTAPQKARGRFLLNLRQILLIMATAAVILTLFRHPISLLLDRQVLAEPDVVKAAACPWSLYGWLFFGTPVINPKSLSKTPMVICMLLANVALAGMLPFLIGTLAAAGFKRLWRMTL